MQPLDLLTLILAVYLVNDYMVNRALPFGVMTWLRAMLNTEALRCFYCSAIYAGIAVYLLWLMDARLVYPIAAAGGSVLAWRYTGGQHT